MKQWTKVAHWVLLCAFCLISGALLFVVDKVDGELEDAEANYRGDMVWYAGRIERELSTLLERLVAFGNGDGLVGRDALVEAYDIFWSRVEGTRQGNVATVIDKLPGARALMERVEEVLKKHEQEVLTLRPRDRTAILRIRSDFLALDKPIQELNLTVVRERTEQLSAQRQRTRMVHSLVLTLFFGAMACAIALLLLVLLEKRRVAELHDLLEEKVAERTRELQRSNQELEQFAYVASHDLQEPLRKISGFCLLLDERLQERLDATEREYLDYVVAATRRQQRQIRDLLTLSRLDRRPQAKESVDCTKVVQQVLRDLELVIKESGGRILVGTLPTLKADREQIVQLFSNLIGNALKYRGEAPPAVDISAGRRGDHYLFEVRDNGIGFEPRFGERIFQMFQRLHRRDEYEGTGIGLAICKKVVEGHKGRIWADSHPGRGSTFYFTLPAEA